MGRRLSLVQLKQIDKAFINLCVRVCKSLYTKGKVGGPAVRFTCQGGCRSWRRRLVYKTMKFIVA